MEMSVQTCGNNSQGSMCRPCIFKCGNTTTKAEYIKIYDVFKRKN